MTMDRDWGGLGAIIEESREVRDEIAKRPLIACPICQTRLEINTRGWRNCPLGHYRSSASTWGEAGLT